MSQDKYCKLTVFETLNVLNGNVYSDLHFGLIGLFTNNLFVR